MRNIYRFNIFWQQLRMYKKTWVKDCCRASLITWGRGDKTRSLDAATCAAPRVNLTDSLRLALFFEAARVSAARRRCLPGIICQRQGWRISGAGATSIGDFQFLEKIYSAIVSEIRHRVWCHNRVVSLKDERRVKSKQKLCSKHNFVPDERSKCFYVLFCLPVLLLDKINVEYTFVQVDEDLRDAILIFT